MLVYKLWNLFVLIPNHLTDDYSWVDKAWCPVKYSLARSDGQAAIEVLQSGLSTNQKDATILEEKNFTNRQWDCKIA